MVDEQHEHCDVILYQRNGHLQSIVETQRAYDSLQYSLIFWNDQNGYHFLLCQKKPETKTGHWLISKLYSFHFMVRDDFNQVLRMKEVSS